MAILDRLKNNFKKIAIGSAIVASAATPLPAHAEAGQCQVTNLSGAEASMASDKNGTLSLWFEHAGNVEGMKKWAEAIAKYSNDNLTLTECFVNKDATMLSGQKMGAYAKGLPVYAEGGKSSVVFADFIDEFKANKEENYLTVAADSAKTSDLLYPR